MNLHKHFDCVPIFLELVDIKNNGLARKLIEDDKELATKCVFEYSEKCQDSNACLKFVIDLKLDIINFPRLNTNIQ